MVADRIKAQVRDVTVQTRDQFAGQGGKVVKDMSTDGKSCIVGNGRIDYRLLFKKAAMAGLERVFVEQEQYDEGTPLYCAGQSLKYINKRLF